MPYLLLLFCWFGASQLAGFAPRPAPSVPRPKTTPWADRAAVRLVIGPRQELGRPQGESGRSAFSPGAALRGSRVGSQHRNRGIGNSFYASYRGRYHGSLPPDTTASSPDQRGPTVLRGHFDHAPAGDTVRLWYGPHQAKTTLTAAGDFTLVLNGLTQASPASLSYVRQRTPLYLRPGDQLHLTLDFARFDETVRYTGRGAAANNYLAQSLWHFQAAPTAAHPERQRTPAATPAYMRQLADAFRQRQRAFLASYAAAHPLPPAFQRQAALDIELEWARILLDYPGYRRAASKEALVLPAGYYDFLRQLPRAQLDQQVTREPVLRLLTAYGGRLLPDGPLRADSAEARRLYAQATADWGPNRARDWAMFQLLAFQLPDNRAAVLAAYPTFQAHNRDTLLSRSLRQLLADEQRLQPGQLAPDFTLLNHAGQPVSLASLRGKVVYLDFWGTWCAPCRQELPAAAQLTRQFAGRNVVFVSIAVRDSEKKWQHVLAAEHLLGPGQVQLLSPTDEVPTAYHVWEYPTYLLIGRDGRVLQARAPRPSAGAATVRAIEQALRPKSE
ncbi:TlpA disulfide reductase family protein [Hymenobacter rigui]|uniref:TlpA family protein disulfide reductase n=1 Tax=Hymenobacter rigui TaxID=334424 RepID=A0A428KM86_9BACT|nr:TlpA disulfide reductase family protein [Hymenobacter rigui]RSK47538.1 TlpA family protein disulfide reductase [Hymenobacter rigui]